MENGEQTQTMLERLFWEPCGPSLTRIITVGACLLFAVVTLFLLLQNKTWAHYDTFAWVTAGGGIGGQVGNKFITQRYPAQLPAQQKARGNE